MGRQMHAGSTPSRRDRSAGALAPSTLLVSRNPRLVLVASPPAPPSTGRGPAAVRAADPSPGGGTSYQPTAITATAQTRCPPGSRTFPFGTRAPPGTAVTETVP